MVKRRFINKGVIGVINLNLFKKYIYCYKFKNYIFFWYKLIFLFNKFNKDWNMDIVYIWYIFFICMRRLSYVVIDECIL